MKAIGIIDWNSYDMFGATLTGRYIKGVVELQNGNHLNSRFYIDTQLRFNPHWFKMTGHWALAIGVNNLARQGSAGVHQLRFE